MLRSLRLLSANTSIASQVLRIHANRSYYFSAEQPSEPKFDKLNRTPKNPPTPKAAPSTEKPSDPRIGKIQPVKHIDETLQKTVMESKKRYLDKWWLKMNVLGSVTLLALIATYVWSIWSPEKQSGVISREPVQAEPDNPNKVTVKFLGLNITSEVAPSPRPALFQKRNPLEDRIKEIQAKAEAERIRVLKDL